MRRVGLDGQRLDAPDAAYDDIWARLNARRDEWPACGFCGAALAEQSDPAPSPDAIALAKRLAKYDRESARRTSVVDDQQDWYAVATSAFRLAVIGAFPPSIASTSAHPAPGTIAREKSSPHLATARNVSITSSARLGSTVFAAHSFAASAIAATTARAFASLPRPSARTTRRTARRARASLASPLAAPRAPNVAHRSSTSRGIIAPTLRTAARVAPAPSPTASRVVASPAPAPASPARVDHDASRHVHMARRAVRRRRRVRPVCVWRSSDKRTHIQNIPKDISAISRRRVALRRVRKRSKKRGREISRSSRSRARVRTRI